MKQSVWPHAEQSYIPTHALSFIAVTLWTSWELLLIYAGAREIRICPMGFNGNSGCARREKSTLNPTSFRLLLYKSLQLHETAAVEVSTEIFTVF